MRQEKSSSYSNLKFEPYTVLNKIPPHLSFEKEALDKFNFQLISADLEWLKKPSVHSDQLLCTFLTWAQSKLEVKWRGCADCAIHPWHLTCSMCQRWQLPYYATEWWAGGAEVKTEQRMCCTAKWPKTWNTLQLVWFFFFISTQLKYLKKNMWTNWIYSI